MAATLAGCGGGDEAAPVDEPQHRVTVNRIGPSLGDSIGGLNTEISFPDGYLDPYMATLPRLYSQVVSLSVDQFFNIFVPDGDALTTNLAWIAPGPLAPAGTAPGPMRNTHVNGTNLITSVSQDGTTTYQSQLSFSTSGVPGVNARCQYDPGVPPWVRVQAVVKVDQQVVTAAATQSTTFYVGMVMDAFGKVPC